MAARQGIIPVMILIDSRSRACNSIIDIHIKIQHEVYGMAEVRNVVRLDQKLIENGIIDPTLEKDYKKVHDMMNRHVRKSGKILTEETFVKGEQALRNWLMLLYKKGATQEKLTSYLRCGLAHLSFDYIESTYEQIDIDGLVTRALQSFKNRNYHNSFFKVSAAEMEKLEAKKRAAKKKAVKKTVTAKKKAVKKKAVKKKVVKKKAAAKKVAKKKVVKKKAVVKKAVKKKVAKKTVKKKAAVKKAVKKSTAKPKKGAGGKVKKKVLKKQKEGLFSKFFGRED